MGEMAHDPTHSTVSDAEARSERDTALRTEVLELVRELVAEAASPTAPGTTAEERRKLISIVVPAYNEEDNVAELARRPGGVFASEPG